MRSLNSRKKNKRSFTFIEMLIVTVMLSIVSLAVFATFNNGINVWQKITRQSPEEEVNIFFDKFAADLRNSIKFKTINFTGKDQMLELPAFVYSPVLQKRVPGSVIYEFDAPGGILNRRQSGYSGVSGQGNSVVLKGIKNLKFLYYYYDAMKKEYFWQADWSNDNLPLAVSVELELDLSGGTDTFVKKVNIPVGG